MRYLDFLSVLHERLEPSTYLEVGIRNGNSLALARCRSVGIDPAYQLTAELDGDVALFRTISDEYFSRPEPLAPFDGRAVDLAFIDGPKTFRPELFEAFRDRLPAAERAEPDGAHARAPWGRRAVVVAQSADDRAGQQLARPRLASRLRRALRR